MVEGGCTDGVGQFVDDVSVLFVRGEGHVAWAGAWRSCEMCWLVSGEFGCSWVEFVDERLVDSKVGGKEEAVGIIEIDAMGVGRFLAIFVGAGAFDLDDGCGFSGFAVGSQSDGYHGATAVIRYGEGAAGGVDCEVAWAFPTAGCGAEEGEGVVLGYGEASDGVVAADGVEDWFLGMEC